MTAVWKGFAQAHQPVRLPKRLRLKDHSVDYGENSRISTDPQRECGDGNRGKSRITAHGADRITDIGRKCRHASIYAGRSGKFAEILEFKVHFFPPTPSIDGHQTSPGEVPSGRLRTTEGMGLSGPNDAVGSYQDCSPSGLALSAVAEPVLTWNDWRAVQPALGIGCSVRSGMPG